MYSRITLEFPENLVVKTKTATGLVQSPHDEELNNDYWRKMVEYAFVKDRINTNSDEWELAEVREAPSGYIVVLNITDNLDGQLAELDYTVTIGFQGKVKLNLDKRSKGSKGADARRDEAAKLVREQAKISARLAQLQEEEEKAAGVDLDMVTAALEGGRGSPTEDGAAVAEAVAEDAAMEEDGADAGSAGPSAQAVAEAVDTAASASGASTGDLAANHSWAEEMEAAAASGQDGGTAQ